MDVGDNDKGEHVSYTLALELIFILRATCMGVGWDGWDG